MNISHKRIIQEGDRVILYERKDSLIPITVKKGEKYSCILGAFQHDSMIGKEYGSLVGVGWRGLNIRSLRKREINICMLWNPLLNCGLQVCEREHRSSLQWMRA